MAEDRSGAFVYMLRCADGSFYIGLTRTELELRLAQHRQGAFPDCYTFLRRPVELLWSEHFLAITDAIAMERRIKGWSRAKKEALAGGDWTALRLAARRPAARADEKG